MVFWGGAGEVTKMVVCKLRGFFFCKKKWCFFQNLGGWDWFEIPFWDVSIFEASRKSLFEDGFISTSEATRLCERSQHSPSSVMLWLILIQVSSEKAFGWLNFAWKYTKSLLSDCHCPLGKSLLNNQ